ncbi:MAG: hypothetical protein JST00_14075 [Deltaproteobacteria bacterium]|nr:hypothetical protein [Deltaproteobacteria bacterium]
MSSRFAALFGATMVTLALAGACDDASVGEPPTSPDASVTGADAGTDGAAPALCVDGKPAFAYPPGPHAIELTKTLPSTLVWEGPDGPVSTKDYFEPCAPRSRVLVIRTSAAWCGTCAWHAKHSKRIFEDPRFEGRVLLLDLVIADRDNMPPTLEAARAWKALVDMPGKVAIDPKFSLSTIPLGQTPLPEYVFVDTKTMQVRTVETDAAPEVLASKILLELADLDKKPRPRADLPKLYDELFTENEWGVAQEMRLVSSAPPPDPTNEIGDDAAAAAFGKTLFSDKLLTPSGNVSCASCHDPTKGFADGTPQSTGLARVDRNSPSVVVAAHSRWQFWDGRADTLWMQALGPPENAKEMGSSRLFIAHRIASTYAAEYGAIFGAKYPLPDLTGLPASGKPGDPAYDALPSATKDAITRVYVNVGKSIAAFERSLRIQPNALDAYLGGDKNAIGTGEKEALQMFFRAGCAQCHWGPMLTDDAFHALRFPTGRQDGKGDLGRADVLTKLAAEEFVATSKWSDAPGAAKLLTFGSAPASMIGAMKTPSLRGIPQTAPYGHGGTLTTLAQVTQHYGQRAQEVPADKSAGTVESWATNFDIHVQAKLPAILNVMKADVVP